MAKPVKQAIDISFAKGLDTKTDPKRVMVGNFVDLENMIFQKGGLLQKRNGYKQLATLPDNSSTYLTTFNGNLTAIGNTIAAYNESNKTWVEKGFIQPLSLSTLPLIRNNFNQTSVDSVITSTGLICTVYQEFNGTTTVNKYVIADSVTGQNIIEPSLIPVTSGTVSGGMRVFNLGDFFIIVFTNIIIGTSHLQYVAINVLYPSLHGNNTDITTSYVTSSTLSWDAIVVNSNLYIAYDSLSGGQSVKITYLSASAASLGQLPVGAQTLVGATASIMSLCADISAKSGINSPSNPTIYINYAGNVSGVEAAYSASVDQNLGILQAPFIVTASSPSAMLNITSAASGGQCEIFIEFAGTYSFDSYPTHEVDRYIVSSGTVIVHYVSMLGIGLASKAFQIDGLVYYIGCFQSNYQNTYFVINGSESNEGTPVIAARFAYENGGGYLPTGLPSVTVINSTALVPYLYKDLIQAVNKNTNVPSGSQVNGIYSQTGINLISLTFGTQDLDTVEIGSNLNISGGLMWMYDGYLPVENNFFLFPDADGGSSQCVATVTTGAAMTAQQYYYQFTYEWTDNQGNAFRSAPSVPITVTLSGSNNSVTLYIPTLRATMKIANPVKICIYRWSVAQEEYYEVTSVTSPLLNNVTINSVSFVDTLADSTILGNSLIYTTGGVVENISPPATNLMTLFDTRLWLVDSEDKNLLWFSKQVIEATPVEMSDLFTMYIAPTTGSQGSTGPITALFTMDDKLIIFKENAIYYVNGIGPDNTGANNQYSQPIFITSTVGCSNQQSIVFMPQGLMFQSDKGIWLLDRSLNSSYLGAPIEKYNDGIIKSALNIPETNQVRFILSTGITLMFDYYYGQWGTFTGVPAISSCIFQNLHTFINSYVAVYQESIGTYVDGTNPVLLSFTTGPLRLGDLQNYQRAYTFFLLGTFLTPHKLQVGVAYDYEVSPSQIDLLVPSNYSTPYGSGPSQSPYGQGTPYGGGSSLEHFRIFLERQRCMAVAISLQEIYDGTYDVPAGAGLTLSGINMVLGFKSGWSTISSTKSYG